MQSAWLLSLIRAKSPACSEHKKCNRPKYKVDAEIESHAKSRAYEGYEEQEHQKDDRA